MQSFNFRMLYQKGIKFMLKKNQRGSKLWKIIMVTVMFAKLSAALRALSRHRHTHTCIFLHVFMYLAEISNQYKCTGKLWHFIYVKKQIHKRSCVDESEFDVTSGALCHHKKRVLSAYLAESHAIHGRKWSPICLPHWWIWQSMVELKASQSFHSGLMEQKSWDVVAIAFYLHRALKTVEININR